MITLANIRRSVYNLFKRVEGIEEFLFQFITDWTDFKEEGIIVNQAFPETWHKTGVLNNLIQDINADDTAVTGKVYTATVSFNDLPSNMLQAELKVEIKEDSGKVILFTLISNETSPYYWLGISSYSGEVVWKSFLTEHQDISGKANTADLATVATTGDYNDLINTPSALNGKSAYDIAVDNGFEGTEQEWLTSLKGEDGQLGLEGPAGQDGAPGRDGINGLDGAPGQDGHTPIITATKSNGVTTIKSDGTTIATINDGTNGLNGQDGAPGLDGLTPHIDSTSKHWIIGSTDTGIVAEGQNGSNGTNGSDGAPGQDGQDGQDGITPHIDPTTKHWMIGETDTNVLAEGVNGTNGTNGSNGVTPHIDSTTGNWFIGTTDTGVHALGPAGQDGQDAISPTLATVATSGSYNDLSNKPSIPSKTSDLTNDSNFIDGLVILSYGISTWNDFISAYNKNKVIYCRASSNANPATGSQTRLAFMAYVSDATSPNNVEFQYYRSVNSHSDSQQGDQVFVYKLTNANVWTVTVREAYTKVVAGTGLSSSYNNGAITLNNSIEAQILSDWDQSDNTKKDYIKNKPTLSTVATSGSYADLSNTPTIPTTTSDLENDCNFLSVANSNIDQNLYVDMGLPSGTLWAKKNIDVTQTDGFTASEYQYECSFFSWGNVDGHNPTSTSSFSPYSFGSSGSGEPYASSEGAKISCPDSVSLSRDAAHIVLGDLWHTPAKEDFAELFNSDYTKFIDASGNDIASNVADKRVTVNSIVGIRLKSKVNGNIIFFPCSGNGGGSSWYSRGSGGLYWSASLNPDYNAGCFLNFGSLGVDPYTSTSRYCGFAVRPIISTKFAASDVAITGDYNDLINKPTILSLSPANSNNHTYVDLGLPSGTLWATTNIGASSLTDIGNYYAYGRGSIRHNGSDSAYSGVENPLSLSVDTARRVWWGDWHTPTKEQYEELIAYTTYTYEYNFNSSGVNGAKFTASNGNYIFLPASGYLDDNEYLHDSTYNAYYLTSSSYSSNKSYCLLATVSNVSVVGDVERKDGRAVRGVLNTISKVSTTGSYNDLLDTPTIPTVPSNETAASGGTTLSVVTTGEKYTWNNKANIWRGTQAQYDLLTPDDNTIYIITSTS